jgi:hypothetical protein
MAARDIREWKITSAIEPVVICLFIVGRLSSKATSERDDERSRIIEGRSDGVCGGPSACSDRNETRLRLEAVLALSRVGEADSADWLAGSLA